LYTVIKRIVPVFI